MDAPDISCFSRAQIVMFHRYSVRKLKTFQVQEVSRGVFTWREESSKRTNFTCIIESNTGDSTPELL